MLPNAESDSIVFSKLQFELSSIKLLFSEMQMNILCQSKIFDKRKDNFKFVEYISHIERIPQ